MIVRQSTSLARLYFMTRRHRCAAPRLSRVMLMYRGFFLRGRWMRDDKSYQIDFHSYADKTNVTLQVRELTRGRRGAVLSMEAADLQELRHERPAEVRMYLEPLLMEICGGRNPLRPGAGDVYRAFEAIPADSAAQISQQIDPMAHVVAIDEAQFLDEGIIPLVTSLAARGRRVIVAGTDTDFRGEPFGAMPELMAIAEVVDKLHAICVLCGGPASRNQRLIGGRPAPYNSP